MYTDRFERHYYQSPPRQCFIREQMKDSELRAGATGVAVPIERKTVKYVVPECDVLDHKVEYGGR